MRGVGAFRAVWRRLTMPDRIFTACCLACDAHAAASDRRSLDAIGWALLAGTAASECPAICPRCLAGGSFLVVVSRDAADRFPLLSKACSRKPVCVTLDRRLGERRSPSAGPAGRRVRDRRVSRREWPASGWLVFQQQPVVRGPLGC